MASTLQYGLRTRPTGGGHRACRWLGLAPLLAALLACGGGSGGDAGSAAAPATAPTITAQPATSTARAGGSVTFSVTASGEGALTYQWQRDGGAIPGATAASYTITAVGASDDGAVFNVVIGSDGAPSVTSADAVLHVDADLRYAVAAVANDQVIETPYTRYRTSLRVFDPDTGAQVASADFGVTDMPTPVQATLSQTLDRATRRIDSNGDSVVLYVQAGKVWKIDLRVGVSHAPAQVSSVADACAISQPAQISADGSDAWVAVSRLAGGRCPSASDNLLRPMGQTFVRTTMSAGAAPVTFAAPAVVYDVLDDGALGAIALLMRADGRVVLRSPDMSRNLADVSGTIAGIRMFLRLGVDHATPQAAYYYADGTLRRMRWTASGVTLEAPIHTFTDLTQEQLYGAIDAADTQAFYFADGNRLLKSVAGAAAATVATVPGLPIGLIAVSTDHLVVTQQDSGAGAEPVVVVLDKSGAQTHRIANAMSAWPTADGLFYMAQASGAWHHVHFDGSADVGYPGGATPVMQRSRIADQWLTDGVMACVSDDAAADAGCSRGEVRGVDAATGTSTVLGRVEHAAGTRGSFAFQSGVSWDPATAIVTGRPAVATFTVSTASGKPLQQSLTDFYLAVPGTAGSLKRLTTQIP